MAVRKLAAATGRRASAAFAVSAVLAAAGPAAAQQPAPPVNTTPGTGVYSPALEEAPGAQRRLVELTTPQPQPRVWASAEYVLWFVQTVNVPELIQAVPSAQAAAGSSAGGVAPDRLFPGGNDLYFGGASGVRAAFGFRLTDTWSLDANGFVLEQRSVGGEGGGDGSPTSLGVGHQYFPSGGGTPTTLYVNQPGSYAGGTQVVGDSRLWGFEGNIRRDTYRFLCDKADLIAGLKYVDLQENLTITDKVRFPTGGTLDIRDSFRTTNRFYGSHGGLAVQWDNTRWHADLTGKMGLGFVNQKVDIAGSNTFVSAGGAVDGEAGGLYARPFNVGSFERDKAAFMGELNLNLGCNVTPNVRVTVGYSILYLSSVMRAGEAIDPVLNDSRIRYVASPTPSDLNAPVFSWDRASDFWAQGVNFGLNVRY